MAEVPSTFTLQSGDPAPDFSLPNGAGEVFSLADVRGEKGTLVVFACNHCPFVIHLASQLGDMTREFAQQGIKSVAINSNDVENYPADAPEKMLEFAKEYQWAFPYLYDESQEVAKAYSAACTPDFFLFDGDGNLYYAGQFDDSRPKNSDPITGDDLRGALEALISNQKPNFTQKPATGCNIKWKEGNAPTYFG